MTARRTVDITAFPARDLSEIAARAKTRKALKDWPQGGYFMAVVDRITPACPQGFPPRFVSQWAADRSGMEARAALELRERCAAQGIGWGKGTLSQAGTPHAYKRPALVKGGA